MKLMNVKKYLDRINFKGDPKPNLSTLKNLQENHLYTIPFENLDIHFNKNIILNPSSLEHKILDSGRGGYCYELNGMFYLLLREIGFNARMVSARVSNGTGGWGEEFDHLTIIVNLDDEWLTDVGFGDSFIKPIKLKLDVVQKDRNGFYKLVKHDGDYLKLTKSSDGEKFSDEYIFKPVERSWAEFNGMNNYHQTSPESHFTRKKICSIATESGRVSLSNDKLVITKGNDKKYILIKDEKEFKEKLSEYFSIELDD